MLEIHEVRNISDYKQVIDKLPENPENIKAVEAMSREGNVIGSGIYSYKEDSVIIYTCQYGNDADLGDGILRAILFKAMLKGIDIGICLAENGGINLFNRMKYTKPDTNKIESINDFLNSCRNCK